MSFYLHFRIPIPRRIGCTDPYDIIILFHWRSVVVGLVITDPAVKRDGSMTAVSAQTGQPRQRGRHPPASYSAHLQHLSLYTHNEIVFLLTVYTSYFRIHQRWYNPFIYQTPSPSCIIWNDLH